MPEQRRSIGKDAAFIIILILLSAVGLAIYTWFLAPRLETKLADYSTWDERTAVIERVERRVEKPEKQNSKF